MAKGGRKGGGGGSGNQASNAKDVKSEDAVDNESSNRPFGSYLRSEEGLNTMKMFVIVNSIVMILTMGWPAMKQAYEIVHEKLEEWELIWAVARDTL